MKRLTRAPGLWGVFSAGCLSLIIVAMTLLAAHGAPGALFVQGQQGSSWLAPMYAFPREVLRLVPTYMFPREVLRLVPTYMFPRDVLQFVTSATWHGDILRLISNFFYQG